MKRKLLITLFSSLALVLGGAIAQDAAKKPGGKRGGSPAERAAKLLEAADKDGDKKLSLEELTAHFEAMAARGGAKGGKKPGGGKKGADKPGEKKPETN